MSPRLLEVCVADAASLHAAVAGGADRIELCCALELGGLTPSPGLIRLAASAPIPVFALVRPRSGDFVYGSADIEVMLADIAAIRAAGLAGVVLGASQADGRLDTETLAILLKAAGGLAVTLHRAFDLVPDITEATETAIALGFARILTSGGARTAPEGVSGLKATLAAARGRIAVMPGSGIDAGNVGALLRAAPVDEVHSSCSTPQKTQTQAAVALGFATASRRQTQADSVAALKRAMAGL